MNRKSLLTGALLFVVLSVPLSAQDLEGFAGVRFRFEAPGARAAAMGGTSEALSDTFTGVTNPASLARIRERRVAIDARRATDTTDFINGGTVGAFTTIGLEAESSGIRGAIVILPTRRATWAVFVDEPLHATSPTWSLRTLIDRSRIELGVHEGGLLSFDDCMRLNNSRADRPCSFATLDTPIAVRTDSRVVLRRIGTAVGFQIGTLSLGGSAQYAELDQRTTAFADTHTAHDRRVTWNAGAQWQIHPSIRAGASYRSGAKFDALRVQHTYPGTLTQQTTFDTPTSYGAGVALDIAPRLTVALDAQRIRYSEMLIPFAAIETSSIPVPLTIPDVTELHAGAEYRIGSRIPVAIRAGWWRDPSHRIRAFNQTVVLNPGDFITPAALFNLALLDEDEDHVTAGIGVGERIRVDAAVDRSKHTTRGSLSLATRF